MALLDPGTAADDDETGALAGALSGGYGQTSMQGDAGEDDLSGDEGDTPDLSAQYDGPSTSAIHKGYEAAIARLKAQRNGLTTKEKIGAALIGFGQPTNHGTKGAIANAAAMLLRQKMAARTADNSRDALIAKYTAEEGPKAATAQAAMMRAGQAAQAAKNKPPASRLGYARMLFPGIPDEQLIAQGKLFSPEVDKKLLQFVSGESAARAGYEPEVEETVTIPPKGAPTLDVFLVEARKANPGVGDSELTAFYRNKYGAK